MPRGEGSKTLTIGGPAPDFDLHVAGTGDRATLGDYAGQWLGLVFLRHVW